MIGWLCGEVRVRMEDRILLETHGVGYEVQVPRTLAATVSQSGEKLELFIHTHVREDEIALYGFSTLAERALFERLISVSGIGPRIGLAAFAALSVSKIIEAISTKNADLLQTIPGVGKRTAERLVIELADKIKSLHIPGVTGVTEAQQPSSTGGEVVSALLNLGYKRNEAELALARVDLSKNPSFDYILRETLKTLAR